MSVCKSLRVEGLCLVALLAGLVGCRQEPSAPPPGPLPVTVLTVVPTDIAQTAIAPAQIEGVREVEVRARVTGILQTVSYAEGAKVQAGDLLFRIDPAPLAAATRRPPRPASPSSISAIARCVRRSPASPADACGRREPS